jgi:N-acetylneuraminic acid mutarotase
MTRRLTVGWCALVTVGLSFAISALAVAGVDSPDAYGWLAMSPTGEPPGRYAHTAVWTGQVMLIFGGYGAVGRFSNSLSDTWAYDPNADSWIQLASAPQARANHTAVWTGQDMLVFGGGGAGLRYDPAKNRWSDLPTNNAPSDRSQHVSVWTGTEMLVWGGSTANGPTNTGARFNPTVGSWQPLSTNGAPSARWNASAVWTGQELLIWGGRYLNTALGDGARYNPATDTWTTMSMQDAPTPRWASAAVWTGNEMLVWGGDGASDANAGARYDPVADAWTPMTTQDAPSASVAFALALENQPAVWTGSEMIAVSESDAGARYNPATDSWTALPTDGAPAPRTGPTAVWDDQDQELIVWGGATGVQGTCPDVCNDGARYIALAPD